MTRWIVALWLACCAIASHRQVPVWHDDLSLWSHAVAVTPTHPQAFVNLAGAYFVRGYYAENEQTLFAAHTAALTTRAVSEFHRQQLLVLIDHNLEARYRESGHLKAADAWALDAQRHSTSNRSGR